MTNTKCAFVAIIGKPNAGKSSLLNNFIGERLSIVTNRPQTTRNKITGILTEDNVQLIFIDTPGFHKPKTKLGEHMVKSVGEAVSDVDFILFVYEAGYKITEAEEELLSDAFSKKVPVNLVINKIDTVKERNKIIDLASELLGKYDFANVFYTSAVNKEGTDEIMSYLKENAPESPFYFPEDYYSTEPEKFVVAEIIREKILVDIRDEIPHGVSVEIDKMRMRENKPIYDIEANIYCEKESHKGIIIGKNGSMLKNIGSKSRADIENFLGENVNLKLWVKVKNDWRNKENLLKSFGF